MSVAQSNFTRSQDYLVNDEQMQGDQNTQQSYKLASGFSPVSFTGGQTQSAPEQAPEQDRSRQQFRTRNRQIRENRPIDFTVSQVEPTRQRIQADIRGQAERISRELAETAPQMEEFLPSYEKALAGDTSGLQQVGQALQTPYKQREIKPLYSTEGGNLLDFLRTPGRDAFQTELARQRGGAFGVNALDAAVLAASGAGSQAFEAGKRSLASASDIVPDLQRRLQAEEANRAARYGQVIDELRGRIGSDEAAMRQAAQAEIDAYRNRDVTNELKAIEQEVRAQNPTLSAFIGGDIDFSPYIDRELTFAETLDPTEVSRYNVIAELLGQTPVQLQTPEQSLNRDAIIQALIAEAQNESSQVALNAQKSALEENLRQEALRKQTEGSLAARLQQRARDATGKAFPTLPEHKRGPIAPLPAPKAKNKQTRNLIEKIGDFLRL